jgi:hypothetical protein
MRERIIYLLVIAILLLLLMRTCKGGSNGRTDYRDSVRTVTRIDTIKGGSKRIYVPKPYKVISHDTTQVIYNNTDTQYIKIPQLILGYSDTLRFDSSGYAVVKDSVLGSILARSFTYDIYKTTVTNNVILNKHNKAFIGFETTYPIQLFSVNFAFQFKKSDNLINLGAGFANSKVFYKAGMLLKIKL